MAEIREWQMVKDLMESRDDMTDAACDFVEDLHEYLDPNLPFLEQQSEEQQRWLYSLWEKHMNQDDEAAQDIYDEE
jgi:hypothetical protein